ncbi:MAG TPA: ATP-binding protein, partial [Solirubrobacterales bacterium]|nr:ATP-binding protein [Solirubrobacterales bacterium]
KGDRLEYTSGEPFNRDEAQAWWLCLDLLKNANRELREVDALLEDSARRRFRLNGVRGVDDPVRMATYIRTEGWLPVDAVVHISDVNRIVEHLGGEQLYGRSASVGVRELIQNGIDAVRARRELESRADDWGSVTLEVGEDEQGPWIEVTDTGIGMSSRVLTGTLLDFGQSLWKSPDVAWELPGLAGRGFQSIGRFGIGFFSVFMLGDRVRVTSRRFDCGYAETNVLEFSAGIEERPLVREAEAAERLHEGGTKVRIWLRKKPEAVGGIFARWGDAPPMSLEELCLHLAPASSVNLEVIQAGSAKTAARANDWMTIAPEVLLRRLVAEEHEIDESRLKAIAARVRPLVLDDGTMVGRACVIAHLRHEVGTGAVVVGGLRATNLGPLHGVLLGEVLVAARNSARPTVPAEVLAAWATEQAELALLNGDDTALDRLDTADVIRRCGGDSGAHPVAMSSAGPLSFEEVVGWLRERDQWFGVGQYELTRNGGDGDVQLNDDVLAIESGHMVIAGGPYPGAHDWPEDLFPDIASHRVGGCDWKLVEACCQAWDCEPEEISVTRQEGDYGEFRGGPLTARLTRVAKEPPPGD